MAFLQLHSDQDVNFESQIIKELVKSWACIKSRITRYHASGNGMTERFNRTLISMLDLYTSKRRTLKQYIAPLVQAYNCIKHKSTGFSPYMLLFGREPRLPVDLAFRINTNSEEISCTEYISDLQSKFKDAFEIVNKML